MGRKLFVLYVWLTQICCLLSDSRSQTTENNQVNDGPCIDVTKSYALPRYNPVKVRDWNQYFN